MKTKKRHPQNKTGRASLDRVAADPRVKEVWEEGSDGYWASLKEGFNAEGCISLHEWTCKDLINALHRIEEGPGY